MVINILIEKEKKSARHTGYFLLCESCKEEIYGPEDGAIKYTKWKKGIAKGFKHSNNCKSKREIEIFGFVRDFLPNSVVEEQKEIIKDNGRCYYYDICIEDLKIIIEINGNYWHANPKIYNKEDIIKYPFGEVKANDIWKKDKAKTTEAEKNGYKVFTVWEDVDYVNHLQFLKEY